MLTAVLNTNYGFVILHAHWVTGMSTSAYQHDIAPYDGFYLRHVPLMQLLLITRFSVATSFIISSTRPRSQMQHLRSRLGYVLKHARFAWRLCQHHENHEHSFSCYVVIFRGTKGAGQFDLQPCTSSPKFG
jgi:hypothetical protein